MATATVARPAQALRQRRDVPRPTLTKRTTTTMDSAASSERPNKQRRLNEPYVRDSPFILQKHKGKPPSLKIHLHDTFFRFDGQDGSWTYDSAMRLVIEHLRAQTVPHELLEELLADNVPFYDGCLIVEVHNHRTADGKERSRHDSGAAADKHSMHNYNQHITPSPFVPYPAKAALEEGPEQNDLVGADTAAAERQDKGKDGPRISLLVLHPTPLTQHHEMLILANTPASEARGKKKGSDGATPSSAQPQTPQLSIPPTPTSTSRGPLAQSQKMALEEGDFYTFQADLLVATQPPLYLEPASTPQQSDKIIAMLSDPRHQGKPPSPQTRKRTTAEMAADDAQAAEAERRMLIMDERIKPSARTGAGTASNENQGTAASLGFSRFKTLEMVRQKHEEQDRLKKEEEARAELEKRQANESQQAQAKIMQQKMRLQQQQQQAQTNQQNAALVTQQRNEMMRQQQMAALQRQAQAQMNDHGHPQANGVQNNTQGNFQNPNAMAQGSPVARQQTPMVNSSPMLPNGGFPMAPSSSQGAGSPPRPTSAAMQNRNNAMARQISQQQHGSQQNTPQMPQGTPSMPQAVPNRQMTQTPRMPPGSPANAMQGTPTSAAAMAIPTPQMGQQSTLTPEQMAMLQLQRQNAQAQGGMNAGSPAQGMTPEQIQHIQRQQTQARHNALLQQAQQAQRNGNPQMMQQMQNQQRAHMMRQAALQAQMQQNMMQQPGQAGSPGGIHQATPQMGHAHPSQTPGHQQQQHPQNAGQVGGGGMPTPEQHAAAQAKAQSIAMQRQLQSLAAQHGGFHQIPPQIISTLMPAQRAMLQQMIQNSRARQAAQMQAARVQQQQLQGNGEQVPAQPNPAYMAALRNNQAAIRAQMQVNQQQQQGQGGAGMGGMAMNVNMNMGGMPGQGQPNGGNGGQQGLDQYFANMQNALNNQPGRGQQGGGAMQ